MKKISLFALVALMSASVMSCNTSANTEKTEEEETPSVESVAVVETSETTPTEGVINLTDDNMFRPDTKVETLTILDFNATWCVPCKKLTPAYDKAAEEFKGKVNFYSVDIDVNKATAAAFNVTSVPTVVFLNPAGKVDTYVGLDPFLGGISGQPSADELTAVITKNLTEMITKAL